jgi:hypothetical protein
MLTRKTRVHRSYPGAAWAVATVGASAVMAALGFGRFSYTILLPPTREGLSLSYTAAGLLPPRTSPDTSWGPLQVALWRSASERAAPPHARLWRWPWGSPGWEPPGAPWRPQPHGPWPGQQGGVVYVQALGLVSLWFADRAKGLASGIVHTGNGAGLALTGVGLPVLVAAVEGHGWRIGWSALALATLGIALLAWRYLRCPDHPMQVVDLVARPISNQPVPRKACRRMPLAQYGGLYGLFGLSYIIYVTFFAETLHIRGLTLSQTGLAWAIVGVLSLVSGPLWGALSDRIGRMAGLTVVFGLQALAYVAFLNVAAWGFILSMALFGTTAWEIPSIMAAGASEIEAAQGVWRPWGVSPRPWAWARRQVRTWPGFG